MTSTSVLLIVVLVVKRFWLAIPVLMGFLLVGAVWVKAADETAVLGVSGTKTVVVKDYFRAGEVVEVTEKVKGDAYVGGRQVLMDGEIDGDLLAAGGMVILSGEVKQDGRIGGGQVVINGKVDKNLTVAGGNVQVTNSAEIVGNLIVAGGEVILTGPVTGDVTVAGGNVTIASSIGGDVDAAVGNLQLTPNAKIGGNLTYWSDKTAIIDSGAKVVGETVQKQSLQPSAKWDMPTKDWTKVWQGAKVVSRAITLVTLLVIGMLGIKLTPKYMESGVVLLKKRFWAALGIGILTVIFVPILFILLLITVVGVPLAFILLALYLVTLYLGRIWVILWGGKKIAEALGKEVSWGWALILGLIMFAILTWFPIIGGLVGLLAVALGVGVTMLSRRALYISAREKEIV